MTPVSNRHSATDPGVTRQSVRTATVVFAATLVLLPTGLAVSGALTPRSTALADAVSTVALVTPVVVSATLLIVHSSRSGSYPAALALGLAAPLAAVCFVVATTVLGLAESDVELAPTIGIVLALAVFCSTVLFLAGRVAGPILSRLR